MTDLIQKAYYEFLLELPVQRVTQHPWLWRLWYLFVAFVLSSGMLALAASGWWAVVAPVYAVAAWKNIVQAFIVFDPRAVWRRQPNPRITRGQAGDWSMRDQRGAR